MLACCHHRVLSTGVFLAATLFLRFPLFYALYFFICPVCTPLISRFIPCPPLVHLAVEADNAFCDCCVSVPGHLARCLETIRVIKAGLQCAKAITRQRTLPQQFPPPPSPPQRCDVFRRQSVFPGAAESDLTPGITESYLCSPELSMQSKSTEPGNTNNNNNKYKHSK